MSKVALADNLADELSARASSRPAAAALRLPGVTISFRQLEILTWRFAMFFHRNGLRPGDVAGLTFANEAALIVAMLATARIGATVFSIPGNVPPLQKAAMAAEANVRLLLTDIAGSNPAGLPALIVDIDSLARMSMPIDGSVRDAQPKAPWLIITGSGSTGRPKHIQISHAVCRARMSLYTDVVSTTWEDRIASLIHPDFPSAKNQYLSALFSGASICLYDRARTNPIQLCSRRNVTVLYAAVIHVERMIRSAPAGSRNLLGGLKALVPAGSVVSDGLRARAVEVLTPNLYVRYGTIETGPITDAVPSEVLSSRGTVGRPLKGVQLEVIDPQGNSLPPGEVGRIRIRSPGMVHAYLDDDIASRSAFSDGWFLPNDIGKITADGQLVFLGRADQMMISDGINIYPAEIETVVCGHPAVQDAAAIPLHSPLHQDIPVCAVTLRHGAVVTEQELVEFAFQRLGSRHPRRIFVFESMPRSEQGKILLEELGLKIMQKLRDQP